MFTEYRSEIIHAENRILGLIQQEATKIERGLRYSLKLKRLFSQGLGEEAAELADSERPEVNLRKAENLRRKIEKLAETHFKKLKNQFDGVMKGLEGRLEVWMNANTGMVDYQNLKLDTEVEKIEKRHKLERDLLNEFNSNEYRQGNRRGLEGWDEVGGYHSEYQDELKRCRSSLLMVKMSLESRKAKQNWDELRMSSPHYEESTGRGSRELRFQSNLEKQFRSLKSRNRAHSNNGARSHKGVFGEGLVSRNGQKKALNGLNELGAYFGGFGGERGSISQSARPGGGKVSDKVGAGELNGKMFSWKPKRDRKARGRAQRAKNLEEYFGKMKPIINPVRRSTDFKTKVQDINIRKAELKSWLNSNPKKMANFLKKPIFAKKRTNRPVLENKKGQSNHPIFSQAHDKDLNTIITPFSNNLRKVRFEQELRRVARENRSPSSKSPQQSLLVSKNHSRRPSISSPACSFTNGHLHPSDLALDPRAYNLKKKSLRLDLSLQRKGFAEGRGFLDELKHEIELKVHKNNVNRFLRKSSPGDRGGVYHGVSGSGRALGGDFGANKGSDVSMTSGVVWSPHEGNVRSDGFQSQQRFSLGAVLNNRDLSRHQKPGRGHLVPELDLFSR